jgi:HlyD family secretion protein
MTQKRSKITGDINVRVKNIALAVLSGSLVVAITACSAPANTSTNSTAAAGQATTLPAEAVPTIAPIATAAPLPTIAPVRLAVSGIGEVKAAQDADLVFAVQGTIAEVKVKEGDQVKKDDVLAILDLRTFDQQIKQAEAGLATAMATNDGLVPAPTRPDVAAAAASVSQAAALLEDLRQGPDTEDVAIVQAAVDAATANLQSTKDRLSAAKTAAELQLNQTANALTGAQARYAQTKSNWEYVQETGQDPIQPTIVVNGRAIPNKVSDGVRENYYAQFVQAEAVLAQSEQAVQIAQVNFETARQTEVTGIQVVEQSLVQANANLQKLLAGPNAAQLKAAEAALAAARAGQSRLTQAPRDSQRASAAAGIAQAEAALELAKINRERAELRAPFDAVVASVNIDPGDPSTTTPPGPVMRLVDVSRLRVEVQISDTDIARVAFGQQAIVLVDALPEKTFRGKVSFIAPAATGTGTVRTYKVRIDLDNQDGLRAGMSVRVEIGAQ